jgi:hypothetical protein
MPPGFGRALQRGTLLASLSFCARTGNQPPGRNRMGKGILLWLIGVPIPVIIVLFLVFHH